MPQALLAIFTQIASVIGGGINGALGMMTSLISKGFQATVQFHKEGIAFAREVGLSAREAQAYTQVLTERTEKLALKYGVAADAIKEVQRGIIDATGKQYMLNEAEAERQVQINKLVGAGTANQFTEQMMNHMGAQLSTVQGAVSKAYATAAKSGLNAAKFSKEVAKNLSLANKLSFRDGVNGIIRMTALSEKLGFNLQSVENAANKFMDLDSAIESSAQLQMLGGAAGAYGSNPLTMAYEANYNPEAFTERMTKMLGGYAQFDAKTGMANVNGMNRDFVKNIAQAMGISMDEAMSIAKKQAEIKYKEGAYSTELGKISKENRDAVLNRSYVDTNTGHLMINDVSGKAHDITKNGLDESILKELQEFDNMSEKDIMQRQAETLTDIQKQLNGIGDSFAASIAKHLNQYIPEATTAIKNFAKEVQPSVVEIGRNVGEIVKTALDWLRENKETIKNVAKGVFGVTAWLTKHWPLLIALWAGKKLLGAAMPGNTTVGGKLGAKALAAISTNAPKALKIGGAALGVGIGAYKAFTADNNAERGEGIGTAAGAVIGTAIAGPLGAAIGGWLGGVGGKLIGEHWEQIKDFAKDAWNGIKDFAKDAWDGIKNLASSAWDGIKELANGVWNLVPEDARNAIASGFEAITKIGKPFFDIFQAYGKGTWEFIKGAASGTWSAIKGVALGAWSVIKGAALGVWDIVKGAALGVWEVIKGGWNGLWEIISAPFKMINDVAEGIKNGFEDILNGNILDGILTMLEGVGKGIFDIISAPFNALRDVSEGVFKGLWEMLKGGWNGIGELVKGIWNGIGEAAKGYWNGAKDLAKGAWDGIKQIGSSVWNSFKESLAEIPVIGHLFKPGEKKASGGIVGGSSFTGDRILTGLNSGEMVLNKDQQAQLFKFINNASNILTKVGSSNGVTYYNASNKYSNLTSSYDTSRISSILDNRSIMEKHSAIHNNIGGNILSNILSTIFNSNSNVVSTALNTDNGIKTIPFGENSFRRIPRDNGTVNTQSPTNVTVKDFNVRIDGTIKLDGGNSYKSININELLNDTSFVSQLKELVKQSINNDINGGRLMNDNAILRGMPAQTTIWGRR